MKNEKVNVAKDLDMFPVGTETDTTKTVASLVYRFERGETVKIFAPVKVVSTDINHLVTDERGIRHEVPRKWIHIIIRDEGSSDAEYRRHDKPALNG